MTGDLRGFVYPLEPLLRSRQWRVDAVSARLGRLQSEIDETMKDLRTLADAQRLASQEAVNSFLKAGDSQAHGRRLKWLVHLGDRRSEIEMRLRALSGRRRALRQEYRREQQALDAIESHRGDAVLVHSRQQATLSANEADRDWLVRVAVRAASIPGGSA